MVEINRSIDKITETTKETLTMTNEELRLKCLELALNLLIDNKYMGAANDKSGDIVEVADIFFKYVSTGLIENND